jgi:predicted MFS family arabinose efflux permease
VARGAGGAFFGAAYPSGMVYVGDTVDAAGRQRELTRLMVGVALGTALASVCAGLVAQFATWRAVFVVTGLAALVLSGALRHLDEPPRTRTHSSFLAPLATVARSRWARFVLLLGFVEGGVLIGALTLLPPAVESAGAPAALAGGVMAVYGAAVLVFATVVGRVSGRTRPHRLIALGAGSAALACLTLWWSRSVPVAVVVTVLLGLAWASLHSSLQTWATEVLPAARATVVSLFAGSLFCGSALTAVAVAGLVDAGRYDTVFGLAALGTVPFGLVAVRGRARWRRSPEPEPRRSP